MIATAAAGAGSPVERAGEPTVRLCPHCLAPVDIRLVAQASKCATCRLVIGAGRSVTAEQAATSGRSAGAAVGSLISRARRESITMSSDPLTAIADMLRVAREIGVAPTRLRMLDYQAAWEADQRLSALSQVVGAFGSWKAARNAAAAQDAHQTG